MNKIVRDSSGLLLCPWWSVVEVGQLREGRDGVCQRIQVPVFVITVSYRFSVKTLRKFGETAYRANHQAVTSADLSTSPTRRSSKDEARNSQQLRQANLSPWT